MIENVSFNLRKIQIFEKVCINDFFCNCNNSMKSITIMNRVLTFSADFKQFSDFPNESQSKFLNSYLVIFPFG